MKNITKLLLMVIISFVFIANLNAAEVDLKGNVGNINKDVGGTNPSITQTNDANTYTFYYRWVKIDNAKFADYVKQRYIKENSSDGSDAYVNAATQVSNYETEFKALIPTVNSPNDLTSGWSKSNNKVITLSALTYNQGAHNGYVIAVAAVKTGDNNVYISREIKESSSAVTLTGDITYFDSDKTGAAVQPQTDTTTTTPQVVDTPETNTVTKDNPDTAVSDWAIYITPILIISGSGILLRRKSYA